MMETQKDTAKAIQYLFGELGETERDAMEDRIFSDEEYELFLNDVEKDLIDDYLRNEMDSGLRQRFEKKYLISERRREKVLTAKVLQENVFVTEEIPVTIVSEPKVSFWQSLAYIFRVPKLALAGGFATILLLALFGGWLLVKQTEKPIDYVRENNSNPQTPTPTVSPDISPNQPSNVDSNKNSSNVNSDNNRVESNKTENREINKPEKKPIPTEKRQVAPPEPRIFVATLLPPLRSDENQVLNISKNAQTVFLRVVHENQKVFSKYRAEIRNQNGAVIFTREITVTEKNLTRPIGLNINNSVLNSGSYELKLSGLTEDNQTEVIKFYNFTVKK